MRDSHPVSLGSLLEETFSKEKDALQSISERAVTLLKLNRAVVSLLPAPMQNACRVANYRKQILILEVANASWLTRLRYELPTLLSALRSEILPSLSSIDIRVNPTLAYSGKNSGQNNKNNSLDRKSTEQKLGKGRHLSLESANELRELARRSPKRLREKLERLAALAGESTSADDTKK